MTCYQEVTCRQCKSNHITPAGYNAHGEPRYRCHEPDYLTKTFMLKYRYRAYEPGIKEQIIDMANKNTVINTLKYKANSLVQVNPNIIKLSTSGKLSVRLEEAYIEAELDEQWSWAGNKSNQRWLWHAVDHATNTILAYMFGKRKDDVFKKR